MADDSQNFTQPYDPNGGGRAPSPAGGGDQGQTWDPKGGPNGTGAWIARGNDPGRAPRGNADWSSATSDITGGYASNVDPGQQVTTGKVRPFNFTTGAAGSWGGYSGRMVDDGNGGVRYDAGQSGRADDVNRLRGLGDAAGTRSAYQINYDDANRAHAFGEQARGWQSGATGLAQQAALGQGSHAQALGQRMLTQGAQAQQAAAMSTRGGSLAQAAAMQQQQAGQAAYMQAGNVQLKGLRADEMAAGRAQYMGMATDQRGLDQRAQGLDASQGINQMGQELDQRGLNQQGQMGYESMAQNVNKSAQDLAVGAREMEVGIDAGARARNSRNADRDLGYVGAGVGAGGSLITGVGNAMGGDGGQEGSTSPWDPSKYHGSDERMKQYAAPLGLAAAASARRRA